MFPPAEGESADVTQLRQNQVWMLHRRQIDKIHVTATNASGQTVAVVTFSNGRCGITLDGQPVDGKDWPADQMHNCTAELLRLSGLND